ncbi:uncharacterized protein AMSG_11817 [Thecamonas trahens ATCC 50062]|uniref:Uncharacterized protein n=1 Tax=Thecamonas trahens ATCC 50062 TaxID=461836 RepID=A0A0L0D9H2_THETB|nr:hypothetical protein AMSG_11817 [Thecamonas trahens ATCC 50062]KNC48989.1 hypothetical protein AMSG_11817 [Thecamonas trahens ATCC 50062]|eukprot:XP_013758453.1 hypothetical protein AMSG_11817 [Thecamonas trahens ATCC 50062]
MTVSFPVLVEPGVAFARGGWVQVPRPDQQPATGHGMPVGNLTCWHSQQTSAPYDVGIGCATSVGGLGSSRRRERMAAPGLIAAGNVQVSLAQLVGPLHSPARDGVHKADNSSGDTPATSSGEADKDVRQRSTTVNKDHLAVVGSVAVPDKADSRHSASSSNRPTTRLAAVWLATAQYVCGRSVR